jgi:RNA polymerase primary sigma factor
VNDLLPAELTSSPEDLDELMSTFAAAGIDLVDSDKGYREREGMERGEGPAVSEDGGELDLTPGGARQDNDPVRMYLREMGTVPLLTREGEVAIAKRIEQGKLSGSSRFRACRPSPRRSSAWAKPSRTASAPSASW